MVNEVIMYQSMFLLGIIAFGFFALSFNNFESNAENLTEENNLEQIVLDIGLLILDLIDSGRQHIDVSSSFLISAFVLIDGEFSTADYILDFDVNSDNEGLLNGYVGGDFVTSFELGFINSTSEIVFNSSVRLFANRALQTVNYEWDGIVEKVYFSV